MKTTSQTTYLAALSLLLAGISPALADAPPTPTGVVVSGPLESHASVSWNASSGATNYLIYRGTNAGGETYLTNQPATTFEDPSLGYGKQYYYQVAAMSASGTSTNSTEISFLTKTTGSGNTFTATPGDSQNSLSWSAAPTATSYRIFRDTLGGPSGTTNFLVTGASSCTDTNLINGTKYWYEVDAINSAGENFGAYAVASATPSGVATDLPGGAPSAVYAAAGYGQAFLRWQPVSNAQTYNLLRGTTPGGEGSYKSALTGNTFTDTGLGNGTAYYYKITAANANGTSLPSNELTATPFAPAAPVVTATGGKGQIVLTWTGNGSSFAIYRGTSGAETLLNSGVAGNTFTDAGLTNGGSYYYKVQALNSGGSSALSGEVSASATALAPTPSTQTVSYGIPNFPIQTCSVYVPDTSRPINGAMFFAKGSMGANLKQVADKYNIIVFSTGNFGFYSGTSKEIALTTSDDTSHAVQVSDFRWYQTSAQLIQAALTAATAQFTGHPEIQYTGLIMYGFSEGCPDVNLPISLPALANRVLGVIQLSELDEDHYGPLSIIDTTPHLFLASSLTSDSYSALNLANPDYTGAGVAANSYDVEARGQSSNQGAPMTVLDNIGAGHGGNPDNPFISSWLDDVLSQRLPATVSTSSPVNLPSWQYLSAWNATYNVTLTNAMPWGTSATQGVQLTQAAISANSTYADPRPFTWLPSQKTANTWLTYNQQAVAYWKLDEPTGSSSYDTSPDKITGSWINSPTFSATHPAGITFSDPGCLSFNGTNQYVDMGAPTVLPTGALPRTLCGWAKAGTTASGYRWIASYGTPGTSEAMFIGMNGTSLIGGGFANDLTVANFWDTNWHFIALTYDGTTATLYADGRQVATAAKTWNLVAAHCYIGCQVSGAQYWNGLIDDVRIYNYALSPTQVYSLGSGTVAYWNLDETAGPSSYDQSPNDIVGSWVNGPTPSTSVPSAITFPDTGSLSFSGTNQYVDMGKPAALPTGAAPRTLCGWAKSSTTAGGYRWIASFGTASTSQAMFIGMNGTSLVAGGYGNDLTVTNFWDTNWHFIALTYDGTTANLYADGTLVSTSAKTWNLVQNHCYIGKQVNSGEYWNGLIDDVRIYNYALTANQVTGISH